MDEQECSKCKKTQPLSNFNKGNKKNGKSSWCKSCESAKAKKWNSNPDVKKKLLASSLKRRRENPANSLLVQIKDRCKRNNIPFNLSIEDCTIPEICPVLGIPIVSGQFRPHGTMLADNAPSVDRLEPDKGYTKGNVAVISWRANHLKNNATAEELEAIARYIRERERS